MYNHAPDGYRCPFCLFVQGKNNEKGLIRKTDLVYQNEQVSAFLGIRKWPKNAGHVVVIPNSHHENIFDLPTKLLAEVHSISKIIAAAMKMVYGCEGILLMQRNGPAAEQQIWHYHLHLVPRYDQDNLFLCQRESFPAEERAKYALNLRNKLKALLDNEEVG